MPERGSLDVPLFMRPPDLAWTGEIQPVPLHRARITYGPRRPHGYNLDVDAVYRRDLRFLWRAAKLRDPLQGELGAWFTFAGSSRGPGGARLNRPDLTNLIKAVEDAGNTVLWLDDRQITTMVGTIDAWGPDVRPEVTLKVWRLAS